MCTKISKNAFLPNKKKTMSKLLLSLSIIALHDMNIAFVSTFTFTPTISRIKTINPSCLTTSTDIGININTCTSTSTSTAYGKDKLQPANKLSPAITQIKSRIALLVSSSTLEKNSYNDSTSDSTSDTTIDTTSDSTSDTTSDSTATITTTNQNSKAALTMEQEQYLSSLEIQIYGDAFLNKLRELLEFKNVHGSCSVTKRYKGNPALGNWVNKTRQMYRKYKEGKPSSMTPERLKVLNEVGFIWSGTSSNKNDNGTNNNSNSNSNNNNNNNKHSVKEEKTIQDQSWMKQYNTLQEYWLNHGKSYSDLRSSQNTKLSSWIMRQRREYQSMNFSEKSTMTKERAILLNAIDFDWSPRETNWNLRIKELLEYKKIYGDTVVPIKFKDNPRLGRWVSTQRKYYKMYENGDTSRITKKKIDQLKDIGFAWSRWEHNWTDNGPGDSFN